MPGLGAGEHKRVGEPRRESAGGGWGGGPRDVEMASLLLPIGEVAWRGQWRGRR